MAISTSRVVVNTTASLLASATLSPTKVLIRRVTNNAALFLGTSSVTTTNGMPFAPDGNFAFILSVGEELYAIADADLDDEVAVLTGLQVF